MTKEKQQGSLPTQFELLKNVGNLKKGKKFEAFGGLVSGLTVNQNGKLISLSFLDKKYFKPIYPKSPVSKIRFPKVKGVQHLFINKTDIEETPTGARVSLKKVTLDGFTIPAGTRIWVKYVQPTSSGTVTLEEEEINNLLKSLYLESIKTIKR